MDQPLPSYSFVEQRTREQNPGLAPLQPVDFDMVRTAHLLAEHAAAQAGRRFQDVPSDVDR